MIVGTRLPNGEIAHFDIATDDYKVARNTLMQDMAKENLLEFNTPILALVQGGKTDSVRIITHRTDVPAKDE